MRNVFLALALTLPACDRAPSTQIAQVAASRRDAALDDTRVADALDIHDWLAHLAPRSAPPAPVRRHHARGDCRTEYAPRPDRDPNPMCLVKGGRFMMGGGPRAPEPTPHEVTVGDFYIDQFEVTTAQAVLFLNAHGNTCHGLDKYQKDAIVLDADQCVNSIEGEHSKIYYQGIVEHDGHFEVRPGYEETPETDFTFEGAMRYCEWVGKQVPSSAEWEYAARHDPVTQRDFVYPWGDRWLANHAACSPCARNALAVGIFDGTHGHGDGSSPWGAHDMAGGTSELVFACADPNETCHAGSPCPCQILSAGGRTDHDITWQTTSARSVESDSGDQGVRCLLPKTR